MTYGAPFEIISDRGKSFLAEGISEFERENSIRHLATTPYHPQTNGMVERMHAMLGHGLTTLVADKRDRWDEVSPTSPSSYSDSDSRCYWILAILPDSLEHILDFPTTETTQEAVSCHWMRLKGWRETRNLLPEILEEVGQARSAANVRTKAKRKQCENETDFDENLRLLLQSWRYGEDETPRSAKIRVQLEGALPVVDVGHPGTYWIMNSAGSSTSKRCNQADLAPWLAPVIDNGRLLSTMD
ncbi:hypothetical protein BASA83_011487 [Batrachochytrium salamandrivorans]|nr:hypothetical protein BASA83_011487 [Batrachochytrium salamandrivorans]